MSFALLAGMNALALICMYLYFGKRIEKRLSEEKLLDTLRHQAGEIAKDVLPELNRVTENNITLLEDKVEQMRKIMDTADAHIQSMREQAEKEEPAGKPEHAPPPRGEQRRVRPVRESPAAKTVKGGREADGGRAVSGTDTPEGSSRSYIMDLYRGGISPELIAKRLELPADEVELVISLQGHKRKNTR